MQYFTKEDIAFLADKPEQEAVVALFNKALDTGLITRPREAEITPQRLPDGKVWIVKEPKEKKNFKEAIQDAPSGFHLPSQRDVMRLLVSIGYLEEPNEEVIDRLSEYGFVWGNKDGRGASYWLRDWKEDEHGYVGIFVLSKRKCYGEEKICDIYVGDHEHKDEPIFVCYVSDN